MIEHAPSGVQKRPKSEVLETFHFIRGRVVARLFIFERDAKWKSSRCVQIADDLLGIHPRFHRISESRTIYLRLTDFFRRLLASIIVKRLSVRGSAIGARTRACLASEHPPQTHMPTLKIVIITNAENIDGTPPKNVNANR